MEKNVRFTVLVAASIIGMDTARSGGRGWGRGGVGCGGGTFVYECRV